MAVAKGRAREDRSTLTVHAGGLLLAWTLAAGTALAAGHTAAAQAGVKGRVSGWEKLVPQVYGDAAKPDSHRYTWREPSPTVKPEFRRLSPDVARDVCVAAVSAAGSGAAAHEPLSVKVTGGRASWATIVLSPGSRLSFRNADPFPHTLYEAGSPQWAPNALAPGSTREWSATEPGVHTIRDQQFPSFVVYVVIDPGAVELAFPDHEGAFSMPLPAGDYTLKAFFDGKVVGKGSVRMGDHGVEIKEPLVLAAGDSKG